MITQKTRYALRSLLFLAEEQVGAPVQLARIAETQRVPPKYLELIMVALDITSGQRMWELNIAGISTPWVAGDWVFVVTTDAKLMCIYRQNGHVRWINQLPQFEKPKKKKGDIEYSGPVLAGNRLLLTSASGQLIQVDPATGNFQSQTDVGARVNLPPVVANSTLYILDDQARLHAYR